MPGNGRIAIVEWYLKPMLKSGFRLRAACVERISEMLQNCELVQIGQEHIEWMHGESHQLIIMKAFPPRLPLPCGVPIPLLHFLRSRQTHPLVQRFPRQVRRLFLRVHRHRTAVVHRPFLHCRRVLEQELLQRWTARKSLPCLLLPHDHFRERRCRRVHHGPPAEPSLRQTRQNHHRSAHRGETGVLRLAHLFARSDN